MRSEEALREALREATDEFVQHRASMRPLVKLLDVLFDATLADMETVSPDKLQRKQGALAQLRALRQCIVDPGPHSSPKP